MVITATQREKEMPERGESPTDHGYYYAHSKAENIGLALKSNLLWIIEALDHIYWKNVIVKSSK